MLSLRHIGLDDYAVREEGQPIGRIGLSALYAARKV
jgi:hypothetical protein